MAIKIEQVYSPIWFKFEDTIANVIHVKKIMLITFVSRQEWYLSPIDSTISTYKDKCMTGVRYKVTSDFFVANEDIR